MLALLLAASIYAPYNTPLRVDLESKVCKPDAVRLCYDVVEQCSDAPCGVHHSAVHCAAACIDTILATKCWCLQLGELK